MGFVISIFSNGCKLCWIVCGYKILEFAVTDSLRCIRSWIILKLNMNLFGLFIIGWGCWSILMVDHKLFCSCCNLIRVVVPKRWELLICWRKLVIWCCNWISQMFRILYKYKLSIVLLEIDFARWDLCLAIVRYLDRILLHMVHERTMLWILYSNVGIITVLITYAICLSVIFFVLAIKVS